VPGVRDAGRAHDDLESLRVRLVGEARELGPRADAGFKFGLSGAVGGGRVLDEERGRRGSHLRHFLRREEAGESIGLHPNEHRSGVVDDDEAGR